MDKEVWKPVVGYEGLYEVSNLGRVRNTKTGLILKPSKGKSGYYLLTLYNNGKRSSNNVHRLVALAFPEICGEWFEGCVVNHKDCNPANNAAANLEICTQQHNATYNGAVEKRASKIRKSVNMLSLNGEVLKTFNSVTEAGNCFNPKGRSGLCYISLVLRGKEETAYGYRWEWA